MNSKSFDETYDGISRLNNTEGPSRNVFEPKFQARDQMLSLLSSVSKAHEQSPSIDAQLQIARCYLFIGNNMVETEEVADGFKNLYRAHFIISETIKKHVLTLAEMQTESDLKSILVLNEPLINESTGFDFVREYVSCLNTLGLHMCSTDSEQKMNDAKKILHLAESAYKSWDKHFVASGGVRMADVPMTDEGNVKEDCQNRDMFVLRHRMDSLYTSTLFFLAQAYTQTDALVASKYAHWTMVHQLETRSEFSKKSWAENALHLSGFYSGQHQYGKALHCLLAGKYMMPSQPDDEETTGRVVWAFGRYHLSRLRYYSSLPNTNESFVDDTHWFVPFPLPLPPIENQLHIKTFAEARDEFKKANANFAAALKYHPFDGQCTDHILILKDLSELYKCLISFEDDIERQVAMHGRRMAFLEGIPGQLNPQAYLTNIRQLQFDIADIANDIFDVRLRQKKAEGQLGKPLSDRKMNALNDAAQRKYQEFLSTFTGEKQIEEVRLAVFRAKMRICALLTKKFHKDPKDEYDAISGAIKAYADVIVFAELNPMGPEVADELELAKQMHTLLPGKMRAIAQAFQHSN